MNTHDDTPGTELVPADHAAPPAWLQRIKANHRFPEIVTQPQPSLADLAAAAGTPQPGESEPGPLVLAWTYAVAMPVAALAYTAQWAARTPDRAAAAAVLVLVVCTAAARISAIAWLIPGFLDVTTWF